MLRLLTKWRRTEREQSRERGCAPSFRDVAAMMGIRESQMSMVARAWQARHIKLQSEVTEENGSCPPLESQNRFASPDASLEADDEERTLSRRMGRLDDRERTVLALRYGLTGELPVTLREIGRRLHITREWVRKIELKAVEKLRD
jgi:RNA polymerase primary sigma factor